MGGGERHGRRWETWVAVGDMGCGRGADVAAREEINTLHYSC